MNKEFVKSLLVLMEQNPELEVMCEVDGEIVCDDSFAWWLGKLNTKYKPKIREYSFIKEEKVIFRDDEEYCEWFEQLYDIDEYLEISDEDWDDFCKNKIDNDIKWKQAIFIAITTLGD